MQVGDCLPPAVKKAPYRGNHSIDTKPSLVTPMGIVPSDVSMRLDAPSPRVRGSAHGAALVTESRPYAVRWKGRVKLYQHGRDAIFFARGHNGAEVWFTGDKLVKVDEQTLMQSDKAKPPKGSCGAFCKGQTSRVMSHYVARSAPAVRIY